jgi:hypothetical protein
MALNSQEEKLSLPGPCAYKLARFLLRWQMLFLNNSPVPGKAQEKTALSFRQSGF